MENANLASKRPGLQWDLLVGLLPLLALAPMLVYQVATLWSHDYMQFFPIVWAIVAAWLGLNLRNASLSLHPHRVWTAIGLMIVAALIYVYSVWSFSPWLAHLALLLQFAAWSLGRLGHKHWATIAGWTLLLATTLPLPWGWDQGVSNWLQSFATWCSAKALDALSVPVLQNGSLIESRDLQLVADEVCGGLSSVYAFAAFAIALGLWQHHSLIVGLKTLLLVPLWTLLGHFLRIFGILSLQEYMQRDFSNGWDYRILEVTTSLVVMLLIWASSRLLKRLFDPIPVADAEFGPVFSGLNKFFCWPQPDPFDDLEPDDEYERKRFLKMKEERAARLPQLADFWWTQNGWSVWLVRGLAAVFLLLALSPLRGLATQGIQGLNFGRPQYSLSQVEQIARAESFPDELEGGWKKVGFQAVQRNPRSRKGEFSLMWRYRAAEREFDVSLDLPFLGWNDPVNEFEMRGWKAATTEIRAQDLWPWGECDLQNELGGTVTLFYSLVTPDGVPYTTVPTGLAGEQAGNSSGVMDGTSTPNADPAAAALSSSTQPTVSQSQTAITYQFQMLNESGVELTSEERQLLRDQFLRLREVARSSLQ
jgi:exosortase/archaeosortase family protein